MRAFVFALLACVIASPVLAQELIVPDAPDLMVKTRQSEDGRENNRALLVLYLKGARQRHETWRGTGSARMLAWIAITQCDARREVMLNPEAKTYAYRDIEDPAIYMQRARKIGRPVAPPPPNGPVTTLTVETTDTGERRPFGSYAARHVITTRTMDPEPKATDTGPKPSMMDGWYLDVPEPNCWHGVQAETFVVASLGSLPNLKFERRGNGRRGYAIEETQRYSTASGTHVTRIDLVEVSEAPLDDALFEPPRDYQPALQTPFGPDMSKPDTILNRLSWYGNQMALNIWHWFNPTAYGAGY
jgi:hypothetical protein